MNRKSRLLIFLIILYIVVSIALSLMFNKKNELYIGNFTKISIYKHKLVIKNKNNKLYNKKAKVYFNEQFIDGYLYSMDSGFYNNYKAVDTYKNKLQFNDDFIAYTGNNKINISKPHQSLITSEELNQISSELEIDKTKILESNSKKYIFDIDSNGQTETIFSIRYDKDDKEFVSYFVLLSNNKYTVFDKYKSSKNSMTKKEENLYRFIDFYNKGKYEVVIQYVPVDEMPHHYKLFTFKNGKLSRIK